MEKRSLEVESKQYIVTKLDTEQYGIDISYVDNIEKPSNSNNGEKAKYLLGVGRTHDTLISLLNMQNVIIEKEKEPA